SYSYSKGILVFLQIFVKPGSDTNCWDCEIPCPTLRHSTPLVARVLFLLEEYLGLLAA
uniref:Uncharacterized protein n=1 Tax=Brassica oleracea var. oleracea TaxID=109376 RepID=A0A0D3ACM6_BRAOL